MAADLDAIFTSILEIAKAIEESENDDALISPEQVLEDDELSLLYFDQGDDERSRACEGSPFTLSDDGSGDVHMDFLASLDALMFGTSVDMILPGERYVTFDVKPDFATRCVAIAGMGFAHRGGGMPRGDLYIHVLLTLGASPPRPPPGCGRPQTPRFHVFRCVA